MEKPQEFFYSYCKDGELCDLKQFYEANKSKIDIHYNSEEAFNICCIKGNIDKAKYLYPIDSKIDIHFEAEYYK